MLGTKILEIKNSKFNGEIKVVKTFGLGTYIQVGGLTQSGGIVESIWRSTLKKIKNKNINEVLILGLGGGSVAKLVRNISRESKITGVDIDPVIVSLGKTYLGLKEVQVKTFIQNALTFNVRPKKYDLIIVDVYKGSEYPEGFEEIEFLEKLKNGKSENGVIIFNRLYYGDKRPQTVKFGHKLEKIFSNVSWHYPEANLMFICK